MLDDVSGVVVGEVVSVIARLHYQGRPQAKMIYAESAEAAHEKARQQKAEILADCGPVAKEIYPTDEWELRIYQMREKPRRSGRGRIARPPQYRRGSLFFLFCFLTPLRYIV